MVLESPSAKEQISSTQGSVGSITVKQPISTRSGL